MKPWTDAEITERNKEIEEGIRQCNVALKDLENEPLKGNNTMNAIAKFEATIEELKQRGMTHAQAVREIAVKNSDLHKDYLREYNLQHGRAI